MTLSDLITENQRRNSLLPDNRPYDPERGIGCIGPRLEVPTPLSSPSRAFVPLTMLRDPEYRFPMEPDRWRRLRCRHDFEYWCVTCAHIEDKKTEQMIPFRLNVPQRRVAAMLEQDRLADRPIRLIMLKARQWGGSTLVQMYMAWIQSVHRRNWHSLICAHLKDTARIIRGMFTRTLDAYPPELWDGDCDPAFRPFEHSDNIRELAGRGCRVTVASAEKQDSVRGGAYSMAHLSETAFWPASPKRTPEDFIRAVCGAIAYLPYTLIAMESTANGVGNFFHSEWLRSEAGKSDKRTVFVPWHEIALYRLPVTDPMALWNAMTDYERRLWDDGLTLEMINWYHHTAPEFSSIEHMHAEYPTTALEAFTNSGTNVFAPEKVAALRESCRPPEVIGDISADGAPLPDSRGALKIWERPGHAGDYIVAMDIGGRSATSDWSVISVMTRGPKPRVVAQWRGHTDHDLLADKAMTIGHYYNEALLVVESNTFETECDTFDNNLSVLSRMARTYPNLYTRTVTDRLTAITSDRVGFHTNRRTKPLLINALIAAVRDATFIERDHDACNELLTYAELPNGSYAARPGKHDDILMTRALALYVIANMPSASVPEKFFTRPVW